MLQHQPSRTAEYMAMFRASEHAKGAGRRVFTDPLAVALLPGSLRLPAKLLAVRPVGGMLNRYIDGRWPGGVGSPRRRWPNASGVIVTVASTPASGGAVRTRIPPPLPTTRYQVSGGSPRICWATVKLWWRDQAG